MSCIFCSIVKKEIKSSIVFEDERITAFDDIAPQAPVHVVIIPKQHITDINDLASVTEDIFKAVPIISKLKGADKKGFRVVLNSGSDAGQAVEHLHFHLLAGRKLKWPPG